MKKCINEACQAELEDNIEICPACGTPQVQLEPHEQQEEPEQPELQQDEEVVTRLAATETAADDDDELATDEYGDYIYTSEWLRRNTSLWGWLTLFLVAIGFGGIASALQTVISFNLDDYGGSMMLASVDIIVGFVLLAISIYTIYAFLMRKRDAVYYAKTYVVMAFVTNVITLFTGEVSSLRGIVWGIVWFIYLLNSNQVETVIPPSFRKVSKTDWAVLASIVVIPLLAFAIGFGSAILTNTSRESDEKEMRNMTLADGEWTDGRVIFAVPDYMESSSEMVEPIPGQKITVFSIKNDSIGECTLCSDYDNENTWANFDDYLNNWEDQTAKYYSSTVIDKGTKRINGHECMYKVTKYDINDIEVYWRYHILFDDASGKCAIVSCYDYGQPSRDYVNDILNSIRF